MTEQADQKSTSGRGGRRVGAGRPRGSMNRANGSSTAAAILRAVNEIERRLGLTNTEPDAVVLVIFLTNEHHAAQKALEVSAPNGGGPL